MYVLGDLTHFVLSPLFYNCTNRDPPLVKPKTEYKTFKRYYSYINY